MLSVGIERRVQMSICELMATGLPETAAYAGGGYRYSHPRRIDHPTSRRTLSCGAVVLDIGPSHFVHVDVGPVRHW
jgi:hypothetical protein